MTSGVYGLSRNPYFAAYLLMFLGFAVLLQNALLLAALAVAFILTHRMVLKEEAYLASVHGAAYADYRRRVPRYLFF
ncbi:MAG: hypothetical protein H6907_10485 [Hyphomicrobiales bacterium]|nr:hypothetical protein [Hyphomicrobiales bacterium]